MLRGNSAEEEGLDAARADLGPAAAEGPRTLHELRSYWRADAARACTRADWRLLAIFRFGQWADRRGSWLARQAWKRLDRRLLQRGAGLELPPQLRCGPGLRIHHRGRGLVIHPEAQIGTDADIYHAVTIGQRGPGRPPSLGDRCYVGVGAAVLGPITLGDDVKVGANAAVITDAPSGCTLVGVPARRLDSPA